jgi:hypothetical protein
MQMREKFGRFSPIAYRGYCRHITSISISLTTDAMGFLILLIVPTFQFNTAKKLIRAGFRSVRAKVIELWLLWLLLLNLRLQLLNL